MKQTQRNPLDHKLRVMFTSAKSIGASIQIHDHERGIGEVLEAWAKRNGLVYLESFHSSPGSSLRPWINANVRYPPEGGAIISAGITVLRVRFAADDEIAAQAVNS